MRGERLNAALVWVSAFTFFAAAGPSLLRDDLSVHTAVGFAFAGVVAGHTAIHWRRVVALRPGAPRRRRLPRSTLRRVIVFTDAAREWLWVLVVVSGVLLAVDLPGETLHVVTGIALVPFVIWHVANQWAWFRR